eukprot:TRINITY_DN10139_c0_g1_i1.p4 TRINITY_DN10139_c0_g1~~TRINITY_DN10139_c0_g1_i1.p4  ORF type:complete len:60 (-),score=2.73 TRINITY_DN10139_c0_g1_i1:282-461(-)
MMSPQRQESTQFWATVAALSSHCSSLIFEAAGLKKNDHLAKRRNVLMVIQYFFLFGCIE